jgi:hypothetical protein
MRANVNFVLNHARSVFFEIDGVSIQNPAAYRADSPLFVFGPLPENNLANAPVGATSPAVAGGIGVLLRPLSPGPHVVRFGGEFAFTQAQDGFDFLFKLEVTYQLLVAPSGLR